MATVVKPMPAYLTPIREPVLMGIPCGMRNTAWAEQLVFPVRRRIGVTVCMECEGDGDWRKYHPEPELFPEGLDCVECKGTGWRFVSI